MIPPDSKIRLFTSTDGEYRGVSIDDGELVIDDSGSTDTEVNSITLNKTKATLKVYGTLTLEATVYPDTATDKEIHWVSDNSNIATVSDNGLVTAKSEGTVIITAYTNNDTSAAC